MPLTSDESLLTLTPTQISSGLSYGIFYLTAGEFTYSIPSAGSAWPGYDPGDEPTDGYQALSANQANRFRAALSLWDSYIAPNFTETNDATSPGVIRVGFTAEDSSTWGYAYSPPYLGQAPDPWNGDIWINNVNETTTFSSGTYDWEALLHEIGHTLGLKHPFTDPALPEQFDNSLYTIMSYTAPAAIYALTFTMTSNSIQGHLDPVSAATPMVLDIAAVQAIYGADPNTNVGNTTYFVSEDTPYYSTIYDAGGTDVLINSISGFSSVLDLNPGAYSTIGYTSIDDQEARWLAWAPDWADDYVRNLFDEYRNELFDFTRHLGIAFSTIIENATGNSAADVIIGNAVANSIGGQGGPDTLYGNGGDDTLDGGDGPDVVSGGDGADTLWGSGGADVLHGDGGDDHLNGGSATYYDSISKTYRTPDDLIGDSLAGDDGNDVLTGAGGGDWLSGGAGDDTLIGGGGVNVLDGGSGMDVANYNASTVTIYADLAAGHYADSTGVWDSFVSVEGLVGGSANDTLFGDEGSNVLQGGLGADTLIGRGGADSLDGGAGNDWLDGGDGDDVLAGGAGVNVLLGGAGSDVASYSDITTGVYANLSAGVYSGAGGRWDSFSSIEGLSGGSGADTLFGDGGNNLLKGLGGADILVGGLGADTLDGGTGNDWLTGQDGDDRLIAGGGTDVLTGGPGSDTFDMTGATGEWAVAFDFTVGVDHIALGGGQQFLGFVGGNYDLDGDGQFDTLLGWANGNFVALDVHGLTLDQWNATLV